jgi:Iap family predicted aminopeptidase
MKRLLAAACLGLALLIAGCLAKPPAADIVSQADLVAVLRDIPFDNAKRAEKLAELFRGAGITDVTLQPIPGRRGRANVVARLPGGTGGIFIVGAHVDHTAPGTGAIDDWSGVAAMVGLARSLAKSPRRHTWVFAGFDMEEEGRVGSRHFVAAMPADERRRVRAMVNMDCLGVSAMKVWMTGSADALEAIARQAAEREGFVLKFHELHGVAADSDSFMAAGIPAITFHSLDPADMRLIDSLRDRIEAVRPERLFEQFKFLWKYVQALDAHTGEFSPANQDAVAPPAR